MKGYANNSSMNSDRTKKRAKVEERWSLLVGLKIYSIRPRSWKRIYEPKKAVLSPLEWSQTIDSVQQE